MKKFQKDFNALFTDKNGSTENRIYSMFVRKNNIKTNVNPIGEILEKRNISRYFKVGNIEIRLIDLFSSYDVIAEDIKIVMHRI
ncbi:MAG: hypothetical protein HXX81_03585 [Campylobacterales bacterium]|nr:hypothetical protein [Campylobacterales bacterium]